MRKFTIVFLLLLALANTIVAIYSRLSLSHRLDNRLNSFLADSNSKLSELTTTALDYTRHVLSSNIVVALSNVVGSVSSSTSSSDGSDIFFRSRPAVGYHYYLVDGIPRARFGSFDFYIGDSWYEGGVITAIYPHCVIVNDAYIFPNSRYTDNPHSSAVHRDGFHLTQNNIKNDNTRTNN